MTANESDLLGDHHFRTAMHTNPLKITYWVTFSDPEDFKRKVISFPDNPDYIFVTSTKSDQNRHFCQELSIRPIRA